MSDPFKIPLFNLHDLIVITTAIAAVLMLVMLAVSPTKNARANHCLTVFFGCLLAHSACIILMWNAQIAPKLNTFSSAIVVTTCLANLLKGPSLLLYVTAITQAGFSFNRKQLIHLVPAIAIVTLMLALNIHLDDLKGITQTEHQRLIHDMWLLMKGLPAVYALACIPIALSTSHLMQSFYSSDSEMGKNWLSLLCIGYAAYWGLTFFSQLFGNTLTKLWLDNGSMADILGIASNYLAFGLLLTLFSYSVSLTQQQLGRALTAAKPRSAAKTTPLKVDSLANTIESSMKNEKLFLQSNLTAEQFAEHVGHATRDISTVLNQHFGKNFFEFINTYRVEEAQRLLISPEHIDTSITDILYMAGFNSKSAFQRFFKRITEMSPSEYRALHKKSNPSNA